MIPDIRNILTETKLDIENMATGYGMPVTDPDHPWHETHKRLADALAPPADSPHDWVCPDCGSDAIEASAWIVLKTEENTGSEGPVGHYWCGNCAENGEDGTIYRLTTREDYARRLRADTDEEEDDE